MNASIRSPRRIWLCADDYGISPGVNRAIRELIVARRLNATSVIMVGPAIDRTEADALVTAVAENPECAIGLHVTLTAPFHPVTMHFRPTDGSAFLPLGAMLRTSLLRGLDRAMAQTEIAAQFAAFASTFGHPPAYADGHQHVHLFPVVRDAFLAAVKVHAPDAWVRQCGSRQSLRQLLRNPKAALLDVLSAGFRRAAKREGVQFNRGFSGAYDFARDQDFAALMRRFLHGLPDGGLIMCHPGFVDDTLRDLDPLTDQRQREFAFLNDDAFPRLLAATNASLSPAPGILSQSPRGIAQI